MLNLVFRLYGLGFPVVYEHCNSRDRHTHYPVMQLPTVTFAFPCAQQEAEVAVSLAAADRVVPAEASGAAAAAWAEVVRPLFLLSTRCARDPAGEGPWPSPTTRPSRPPATERQRDTGTSTTQRLLPAAVETTQTRMGTIRADTATTAQPTQSSTPTGMATSRRRRTRRPISQWVSRQSCQMRPDGQRAEDNSLCDG